MGRGRKIFRGVENNTLEDLSQDQKEVLYYLTKEFLTIKQIANLRHTSDKAVYKIISKLKSKGILKGVEKSSFLMGVGKSATPPSDKTDDIYRLHALSYRIDIIDSSKRYDELLKSRNKDELDKNTLMLNRDHILIYLNKDFWGLTPDISYKRSLDYINHFITILENNYKIILKKGRQYNLKQFRSEIAKTNDPYAKTCNLNKDKIKIYDDNGILRLLVDNSFNLNELEAVSNEHNREDMTNINEKWLDLIKTDLKLSDVHNHLKVQQHINAVHNEKIDKILLILEKIANN